MSSTHIAGSVPSARSLPADAAQRRYDAAAVLATHSQVLHLAAALLLTPLDPVLVDEIRQYANHAASAQDAAHRLGLSTTDLDQVDLELLADLAAGRPGEHGAGQTGAGQHAGARRLLAAVPATGEAGK